jgi:hypothetical protein
MQARPSLVPFPTTRSVMPSIPHPPMRPPLIPYTALSAQRLQDIDLYYQFTGKVTGAPSALQSTVAVNH